jgi:chromosome partitioning protein
MHNAAGVHSRKGVFAMSIVIAIAQRKGGAGKTTLAAHLAVALKRMGERVALVDIDPQASLTRWHKARLERTGPEDDLSFSAVTGWRTQREVETLAKSHGVVIVDLPPHAETEARIAVRAADLVLIPLQPSPMDLWATEPSIRLAKSEGSPCLLVLNRVPPRGRLAEKLSAEAARLGAGLAEAALGNRVHFAEPMLDGLTALEIPGAAKAAEETRELAAEILRRIRAEKRAA